MYQTFEYCPTCEETRSMTRTIALRQVETHRGEVQEALVWNLHCSFCQTFVNQIPFEAQSEPASVQEWTSAGSDQ